MGSDGLRREWIEMAPAWIKEVREGKNENRNGLLDWPMLEACGDVSGLRILDCGCGEGRFCRMLAEGGAEYVLGVDLCEPMIVAAKDLQSERDEYRVADAQDLGVLDDGAFDIVVSYLNQCDLPDVDANNKEVFRVLKSGGRFIIANLHPMRSAVGGWLKAEDGSKRHVILDNYFDEGERHWKMQGIEFTNFHRSLETTVRGFLDARFVIEGIVEKALREDQLALYPGLVDELRVPNFIVYMLKKP